MESEDAGDVIDSQVHLFLLATKSSLPADSGAGESVDCHVPVGSNRSSLNRERGKS